MKPKTPDTTTAATWKCSLRTARRWRKDGAPIADPDAMRAWLAGQRTVPAGTRALLDASPKRRTAAPRAKPSRTASTPPTGAEGAPAALLRLEAREAEAHAAYAGAVAANDPAAIRSARMTWLALLGELRKFDESVDERRRHAGASIPLPEAEADAALIGLAIGAAFNGPFGADVAVALARADSAAAAAMILSEAWPRRFIAALGWVRNQVRHPGLLAAYLDGVSGSGLKPAVRMSESAAALFQELGECADQAALAAVRDARKQITA